MQPFKLLLLTFALTLSACAAIETGATTPAPESSTPSGAEDSLAGTRWELVSLGALGAETPVIEDSTVTLEFSAEGQATGSGGCNSYGGQYQVQDNTVSFSEVTSTLIACADQGVTEQERQYFQALESTGQFELRDNQLTIQYNGGQGVLNFVKTSA